MPIIFCLIAIKVGRPEGGWFPLSDEPDVGEAEKETKRWSKGATWGCYLS